MFGKGNTKRGKYINNETSAAQFIPATHHINDHSVKTINGDMLQVIRVDGLAFETADNEELSTWLEGRNNMYKNIAGGGGDRAIWTTIIRREHEGYPGGEYEEGFAKNLNKQYRDKLESEKMFVNDLYISILVKSSIGSGLIPKKIKGDGLDELRDQEKTLSDLSGNICSSMGAYGARPLGLYEHNDLMYSEVYEYFGHLVNGFHQRVPLTNTKASSYICNVRHFFGQETIEIRTTSDSLYCGALGVKEYCNQTRPGMLDGLLQLPFEFVLSQSFVFLNKMRATNMMIIQRDKMVNSGDLAETQIDQINQATDELMSGEFVMGDHCLTFTAYGKGVNRVQNNLAKAATTFGEMGFVTAREDLALESAFWSQLPGNMGCRARKAPITSRNFGSMFSGHNFPTGKATGNHWGDALMLLKTTSGTPYYLNFHSNGGDLGNTTVIGPSGTGKTVVMGMTLMQAEKFKPKMVLFDKDRGAEIFIRGQGGNYTPIHRGVDTGFNPFQMDESDDNRTVWNSLIEMMVTSQGETYTTKDRLEVDEAVQGLIGMPKSDRNLTELHQFLDVTREDGVANRLKPWLKGNEMGWVFDNSSDSLNLDSRIIGFDITELLDKPMIRTPVLFYLFHRVNKLINGDKIIIYIEEGWKALEDAVFSPMIQDWQKTIRKRNGVVVFGTQSPADVVSSKIGQSILEQSPTNIFMPNPKAKREHYVEGFGLSEREYQIIKTLPEKSRMFLISQGGQSVIVNLDLSPLKDVIPVLSGTEYNIGLLDTIRETKGDQPKDWLPEFLEQAH